MSVEFSGESSHFYGIADDQEHTVRFGEEVELVGLAFVSGQEVRKGDLMMELRQPDLESQASIVQERIHALQFGNREGRATSEARIVQEEAALEAKLTQLDGEIRLLQSRLESTNAVLQSSDAASSVKASLEAAISDLRIRRRSATRAARSRISDLQKRLATEDRPVHAQIAELQNRMLEIERKRQGLKVMAPFDGRIGSIEFQLGDRVAPYQPLLTVHGARPSFVRGYIHESVQNRVQIGQQVWVHSLSTRQSPIEVVGTVSSLGTRIVEFPERLKVNPLVQAWGREVIVLIEGQHDLLLGEKVDVLVGKHVEPLQTLAAIFTGASE